VVFHSAINYYNTHTQNIYNSGQLLVGAFCWPSEKSIQNEDASLLYWQQFMIQLLHVAFQLQFVCVKI
jgi:hypothetical protein